MSVVTRIRELAAEKNLTIKDVERLTGISTNTMGRWDTNKPSVEKLTAVADLFGVTLDYLVGRSNTPYSDNSKEISVETFLKRSTPSTYDGVTLSDSDKRQIDLIIRTVIWPRLQDE